MNISINSFNKLSFKSSNFDYTSDSSAYAREMMRLRLEKMLGAEYLYQDQFKRQTIDEIKQDLSRKASSGLCDDKNMQTSKHKVDYSKLEKLKLFVREKRKNELYSGGKLSMKKDGIRSAVEAGIRTIVSMGPDIGGKYEKEAKNAGLNFISVDKIGNCKLDFSSITPDTSRDGLLLRKLIRYPNEWATVDKNGKQKDDASKDVCDLQSLIDILDGKNAEYQLPIYYGCEFGCERTSAWTAIYNILKNEDRTKPLSAESLKKLIKFESEESDY